MKCIVGLGNPGRRYEGTRHNVGFRVVGELSRLHGGENFKRKFDAEVAEVTVAGSRVLLVCPTTYMNRSGRSVRAAVDFYRIESADLLIVCDDINLPVAKLRFRSSGSAGGQKGLADIIASLGTEEFSRLRIGVGRPPEGWDAADYVLGRFAKEERPEIDDAVLRAADAATDWICSGIVDCMNRYN